MTAGNGSRVRALRMTLQYHETFGHWFVPRLRAYVPHERGYYAVVTNSRGMRSAREYPSGVRGARRILAFGDSFTAADGVSNEERFTDLLEASEEGLEVLNFGLPGSGTDQQLLIYQHLGRHFDGDILLICPLVENINRIAARYRPVIERDGGTTLFMPKPYFTLQNGSLELHGVPVPRKRFTLADAPPDVLEHTDLGGRSPGVSRFVNRYLYPWKDSLIKLTGFDPYPQYSEQYHPHWRLMKAILGAFVEWEQGREVVIAPLPTYHYIEGLCRPTYMQRFQEFTKEYPRVHLINVLEEFWCLSRVERRACRYHRDIHYTPLAHSVVARALRKELRSRKLL